ncbi:germination protein YpeB [Paenibacillus sp. J5C_2022]|uniref:germination protein YpeB n=1 Tax=Paenibacillus sp. J5C2022 TaxID=2977129 RepID=UPI0021D30C32|nr:germination protein YpeB [Paenibacillus sp. J5C2022]MCU6710037.1 germination protein YpeB [Paenibacillus sp. J5C2022]
MYRKISAVLFPIVTVMLIGSVYWGYQMQQDKSQLLIKAENQYQRAFHNLTSHVEKLHEQLGNTLAVNSTSKGFHQKGLVNVWRLTSEAQNEISQLPLSYLPFTETENFLSHISNFAYKTAVRDLTKKPLSEAEFKTLKTLYEKSDEIAKDLHHMQQDVLSDNLRWMDVELAIAAEEANGNNMVVQGLRGVDEKVGEYPELDWGPSVMSMYEKRSMKMLSGDMMNNEEIRKRASSFVQVDPSMVEVSENGKGTEYASFSAVVKGDDNGNGNVQMDFAQRGGALISYMRTRAVDKKSIDFPKAKAAADQFLQKHGFKNMQAVTYDEYHQNGVFTYVESQNDVLVYPDKVTVKIALDNGEAVGLQASDYVFQHRKRDMPGPVLTKAEARKSINPELKVKDERLALIKGDSGDEVLCYEFVGGINGSLYRVYINAETGLEESVEIISAEDVQAAS